MAKNKNIIMPTIKIAIEAHFTKNFLNKKFISLFSNIYSIIFNLKSRVFLK